MLILAKAVLAMMIGFITAVIFGLILIPFLKRIKVRQKVSTYLEKTHKSKEGTPTMGGLIFIIPTIITIIILLLMNKIEFTENLFIILFVFISYALLGFLDDFLIIKRHNNEGLTEIQKLSGQLIIALIFFYIFMRSGGKPILDIHTLGIQINMGWFYGIFLLFLLVASSNAVNITDGLDGLAGGLSVMAFLAFGLIAWNSDWVTGNQDIAIFCFVLIGSLLIKFTKILWIDSVISIFVSLFILLRTIKHLNNILDLFLMKKPVDIDLEEIKKHLLNIEGVKDIHHIHIWSLDGINNFATLHVVTDKNIKHEIRSEMKEHGINNVTIEIEDINEKCHNKHCKIDESSHLHHHHH